MVSHFHLLLCILTLLHVVTAADRTATTEDGKKVVLHDNGRWEYLVENKKPTVTEKPDSKRVHLVELIKNDLRFDFRNVRWGMSKKEVIAAEKATLVSRRSDTLYYDVTFLGYKSSVVYFFDSNVLYKADFIIHQTHIDPSLFYKDFNELKSYFTKSYGKALSDKLEWKNEIYKKDKSKWGFAISIGFLVCRAEWNSNRTRIILKIKGSNHQISTKIVYTSIDN